jgi:hypothetical protein
MKVGKTTCIAGHPSTGAMIYATNMMPQEVPRWATPSDIERMKKEYEEKRKIEAAKYGEIEDF